MNTLDFEVDDPWDTPQIGRPLMSLLTETLEVREQPHSWLPAGLTLLGGKTKSGKSTLAEQIAEEISFDKKVLYLALEYNKRMAQGRFDRFKHYHQIHLVLEGEINRMGKGGERELEDLISTYNPELVIVDILAKLKRQNTGHYDAEYQAMTDIKELIDKYDKDCLVLTHSGKPTANDSGDPFDKIIGSTALQGVPDNLMVLSQSNGQTKLHTKGRLIFPSEKTLSFENGKYTERSGVGAEYQDKAPAKAEVLKLLETKKMTVSEMAHALGKDKGQISNICAKLSEDGQIKRDNRRSPWEYVGRTPEH
jgi:adenosyl cobinamide kinase/adenosyl cobinamide phosphate guanylyltransferase